MPNPKLHWNLFKPRPMVRIGKHYVAQHCRPAGQSEAQAA
jgi:hypothetical protein